jgi:Domain of unknown function (DUF4062)
LARIFISSTTEDLKEHRRMTTEALSVLGHQVVAFEVMGASPTGSPLDQSRSLITSCDLFIALVAWRYGFVPPGGNPQRSSFVELECRYAWELKKPTLIFITKDNAPWPRNYIDDGADGERQKAFRSEVLGRTVVGFFTSAVELSEKVTQAVREWQNSLTPTSAELPSDIDALDLAFRLVIDRKAEPTLLLHMNPSALSEAVRKWAHDNDFGLNSPDPFAAHRFAFKQLKGKYQDLAPNPLWVAWMRATRVDLFGPAASGQLAT